MPVLCKRTLLRLLILGAPVAALLACREAQEVLPTATPPDTALLTPTPTPTVLVPSPTPPGGTATPQPAVSATPTATPPNIVMTMEGPAHATPGETVTYRLIYDVQHPVGTEVILSFPNTIKYISSRLIVGSGEVEGEPTEPGFQLRWGLRQGSGVLEVTFQVPGDISLGSFAVGAYEPGSGRPDWKPATSNPVTTTVVSP